VCGICRTDLHVIEADLPPHHLPLIPGHQVVGVVDRAGTDVKRFREGDRVGIAWLGSTCQGCTDCARGRENLCASSRYTGYDLDGGYAEHTVVRADYAYAIPSSFADVEAAPLLCAGIIGYRALRSASVPRAGTVTLYGFGSSAHVVLQIAKHRGCGVFVATRGEGHRRLAREMGADWVGDTFDAPPEPTDSAIVFAPAGEIVPAALRNVRKGGTVALAGIHMSQVPAMDYEPCLFHEKTLRSVEANTRADGAELLAEAAEAGIRPRVTTFPLEQANEALIRLADDRIDGSGVLVVSP
jgi:propanol-preferring alcohol dehydrogenase